MNLNSLKSAFIGDLVGDGIIKASSVTMSGGHGPR